MLRFMMDTPGLKSPRRYDIANGLRRSHRIQISPSSERRQEAVGPGITTNAVRLDSEANIGFGPAKDAPLVGKAE
jgi:hypothetical protein